MASARPRRFERRMADIKTLLCEAARRRARRRAIKARPMLGYSGGQDLGGDGSGGGDRPCSVASSAAHTSLQLGGIDSVKAATPSAGAMPTQATTQPAAGRRHGTPSPGGPSSRDSAPAAASAG